MHSKKILVIGSKGHPLADRCVDWLEPFPYLGDYHTVVINMQSLTGEVLSKLYKNYPSKLKRAREDLGDVIWHNTTVICITQKNIQLLRRRFRTRIPVGNYDWCPITLFFEEREGSGFKETKEGYLRFVKKWSHYLRAADLSNYKCRFLKECNLTINPILTNLVGRPLAFDASVREFTISEMGTIVKKKDSHLMRFLPPPTEISIEEGINFLLKNIVGYVPGEIQLPEWAKNIPLPGEKDLLAEIRTCEGEIKKFESKITGNKEKLNKLNRYKALLTSDGETLEALVEEAMEFLGVKLERGPIKKEDRVFREGDAVIPIEIKGRKASIPESDLRQIIIRLPDEKLAKYTTRGVLIGNHYKKTPLNGKLEGRKRAFEPDVIGQAEKFNICLVSTLELFKALYKKLASENLEHFKEKLFNTIGEFALEKNVP